MIANVTRMGQFGNHVSRKRLLLLLNADSANESSASSEAVMLSSSRDVASHVYLKEQCTTLETGSNLAQRSSKHVSIIQRSDCLHEQ